MKIKQSEAVKAYRSLQGINQQKLSSAKLAKQVYDLYTKIQKAFNFQVNEEQKIFKAHPDFDPSIGGIHIAGKSEEEQKATAAEIKEIEKQLQDVADLDFEIEGFESPIEIDLDAEPNLKLSGEDIGNLKNLVDFK